jgi:hypothetical protein
MEETSSLSIEGFGLKATALGALPVSGLLLLMGLIVIVGFIVGPSQIARWTRRLTQQSDK